MLAFQGLVTATAVFAQVVPSGHAVRSTIDTIYCTSTNTSYLIFRDKVELVDLGNPMAYFSQIEGSSVFIKAQQANSDVSTLLVKTEKDFCYAVIKNCPDNKLFFYDFTKTKPARKEGTEAEIESKSASDTESDTKSESSGLSSLISRVAETRNELFSMGFISEFIEAAVTVIRNDSATTYLKIVLTNKSSIPYKLDFISFQYYRHLFKGFAKKGKKNCFDVFPLAIPSFRQIDPLSCRALGYAIPSFGLAGKGYLMVSFRESSGDRILKIEVPGSEIQKARVLHNGKK